MKRKTIKEYCSKYRLRLEQYTETGFIASELIPIKAGIQYNPITGKINYTPIKTIGKKRIYTEFKYYNDGDIVHSKKINKLTF